MAETGPTQQRQGSLPCLGARFSEGSDSGVRCTNLEYYPIVIRSTFDSCRRDQLPVFQRRWRICTVKLDSLPV